MGVTESLAFLRNRKKAGMATAKGYGVLGAKVEAGEVGRNLDFILRTTGGMEGFLEQGFVFGKIAEH